MALRAIEIRENVCALVRFWLLLPSSKRPTSKSYQTVLAATEDPLILAKLHFFAHISGIMKHFLANYQCIKPMMPFMYDDLHQVLRDMSSKFIKADELEKYKTGAALIKMDFCDSKIHSKDVEVDCGASKILSDKTRRDEVTKAEVKTYKNECIKFLVGLTSKFAERSPLQYAVVKVFKCLNPSQVMPSKAK